MLRAFGSMTYVGVVGAGGGVVLESVMVTVLA